MVAAIGDIGHVRSGRPLAAYLGLVPKQRSSGGKERLGRGPQLARRLGWGAISRRGNGYRRTLLMIERNAHDPLPQGTPRSSSARGARSTELAWQIRTGR